MYRKFDPERDSEAFKQGRLFEHESVEQDGIYTERLVKVIDPARFQFALKMPIYFAVKESP